MKTAAPFALQTDREELIPGSSAPAFPFGVCPRRSARKPPTCCNACSAIPACWNRNERRDLDRASPRSRRVGDRMCPKSEFC